MVLSKKYKYDTQNKRLLSVALFKPCLSKSRFIYLGLFPMYAVKAEQQIIFLQDTLQYINPCDIVIIAKHNSV